MFAVPAFGQVKDEVASCAAGCPGGDGDEVAADGGGAGPGVHRAGEGAGGAEQVLGDGRDDQPGGVGGECPGWQVRERAVVPVGEDLLDDGVVAVFFFCLRQDERRVGEYGVVAPGGEQLALPRGGLRAQVADAADDQPGGDVQFLVLGGERGIGGLGDLGVGDPASGLVIEDRPRGSGSASRRRR